MQIKLHSLHREVDQYCHQQKFQDARDVILEHINESEVNHYILRLRLAVIYEQLKDYQNSYIQYQLLLNDKPTPYIYYKLGFINHHYFIDHIMAQKMYNLCLRMKHDHLQCLFELAKLLFYELKQFNQSRILFTKCVTLNSVSADIWYNFAELLYILNEEKQMKFAFAKAIELQPNSIQYYQKFAKYSEFYHEYNKADYLYRQSLQFN